VLAFDGSAKRDASALVAATLDGFVTPVQVWERPEKAPADWRVPRDEVNDVVTRMMNGTYQVVEVAVDPFGWGAELEVWAETYEGLVTEFPTNSRPRMGPACDRFRAEVLEGVLSHDGSQVLARHIGHAVAKLTPHGTVITKSHPDSPRKIDAAVAAVVAHERASWHASQGEALPAFAFV
jgi:phage terminase large subunit-like protein